MTFYICVEDLFGYCVDRPRTLPKPSNPNPGGPTMPGGGSCSKNPAKCGSYATNSQKCLDNPLKSRNTAPESQKKAIKKKK